VLGLARKQTLVRSRREDRWRRINAVAEIRYQRPARTCGQTRSSATCGLPTSFTRGLNLQSFQDPWPACEKLSTTTDSECKNCLFVSETLCALIWDDLYHASVRPGCSHVVHSFVRPFVRSLVCYQILNTVFWKRNGSILMSIGTDGPRGKSTKRSTLV